MRIFLIRHGDPDYVHDSLTDLGRKQAEAVCGLNWTGEITDIICSPLGRAQETATPLAARTHVLVETKEWLREIDDITVWSEKRPDLAVWNVPAQILYQWEQEERTIDSPDLKRRLNEKKRKLANGMSDVLRRYGIQKTDNGWCEEDDKWKNKNLAIFCHLGVGMLLISYLLDMSPFTVFRNFYLSPSSVTSILLEVYGDKKAGFRIIQMGDTSHLYKQGIEVSTSGLQYNVE